MPLIYTNSYSAIKKKHTNFHYMDLFRAAQKFKPQTDIQDWPCVPLGCCYCSYILATIELQTINKWAAVSIDMKGEKYSFLFLPLHCKVTCIYFTLWEDRPCGVLRCEAWCVAWSGGELTLQQRSVPESCSLNSCLGNKDKLLCGCTILKK